MLCLRAVFKNSVYLLVAAVLYLSLIAAELKGIAYPQTKGFGGQV